METDFNSTMVQLIAIKREVVMPLSTAFQFYYGSINRNSVLTDENGDS